MPDTRNVAVALSLIMHTETVMVIDESYGNDNTVHLGHK